MTLDRFTAPVRGFDAHTRRTRLLTLDARGIPFAFHGGQAVWLRRAGHPDRKPYSIASAPADLADDGRLDFLVGLEDSGEPGAHLAGLAPGSLVEVQGPLGGFDLPRSVAQAPIVLVGGGTGIAPLRAIWRERLAHPDANPSPTASLSIVYSVRAPGDLAFLSELEALERAGRIRLAVTVTGNDAEWAGGRGRLTGAALVEHVTQPADIRCAICGPEAFVGHVVDILTGLGVPADHVATQRWE